MALKHVHMHGTSGHAGLHRSSVCYNAWLLECSSTVVPHCLPSWPACSTHPVDWNDASHELAQREPRRGRRLTLAAQVHTEQRPPLLVYSVHLEVLLDHPAFKCMCCLLSLRHNECCCSLTC